MDKQTKTIIIVVIAIAAIPVFLILLNLLAFVAEDLFYSLSR